MPIRKETYKAVLEAALSIHTIHESMREAIHHALTTEGDPKPALYAILTAYNIPARELALLISEHRVQTVRWGSNNRRQAAARRKRQGAPSLPPPVPNSMHPLINDTTLSGLQTLYEKYPITWRGLYGTADPPTIHNLLTNEGSPDSEGLLPTNKEPTP